MDSGGEWMEEVFTQVSYFSELYKIVKFLKKFNIAA
jgi:hypothetical protein